MYKNTFSSFLILVLSFVFCLKTTAQTDIAVWDFEGFPNGFVNPATSFGTGVASVITQSGVAPSALGTAGGNGNATGCGGTVGGAGWQVAPFDAGTFNESNGVEFRSSTIGYENIFFNWDQRWSNTSPNTIKLQFTIDGSTWVSFPITNSNTSTCLGNINANGTFEAVNGDLFRRFSVNLTSISGANNNTNFGVRILASHFISTTEFRQAGDNSILAGTAGTWRFDNVAFTGSLFAGPSVSTISASPISVCGGDSFNLNVAITGGNGPFNLIYNDGTTSFTIPNYISGTAIPVTPTSTKTYTIVSVQNAPAVIGTSNLSGSNTGGPSVTFIPKPTFNAANDQRCTGITFDIRTMFTAQSPTGGTSTYQNDANGATIGFPSSYNGGTVTVRYTYTKSGCSTVKTAVFTRTVVPSLATPPSTTIQTVCQGDAFPALSVVYNGAPVSYTWFRNTTSSNSGGIALTVGMYPAEVAAGSQTANFTPLNYGAGLTYYYYARASNSCGTSPSSAVSGAYNVVPKTTTRTISAPTPVCFGYAPSDLVLNGSGAVTKWQKSTDPSFASSVTDIANTAATQATGNITADTYFRAVVNNGSCDVATTPVAVTVKYANYTTSWDVLPDATTTAVFWDNFSSTSNISACNVIIKPGKNVVFNTNHTLTVQNEIDSSAGTLTFENNANLHQVNDNANNNSGNIVYKRNSTLMKVYDFTFWSSPVFSQNLKLFSPNTFVDKYFTWNSNPAFYNWEYLDSVNTTMERGRGYCIRSPLTFGSSPAIYPGVFSGIPNNGIINKNVQVSNGGLNSLNLIGNPYPSAIKADNFLNDNGAVIKKSIYLWTHNSAVGTFVANQYSGSDYATYNLAGGLGTQAANNMGVNNNIPNGFIAAGQGFFVQAIANGNVVFNNTMRDGTVATSNQFYRNANNASSIEKNRVWLEMSNPQGAFSQTLFGFIQNATDGVDDGYDTNLFDDSGTISLYSVLNNEKMSIKSDALPFSDNKTNAVGFISKIDSNFEIKLAQFDGLFDNQEVFLQDNLLNVVHDLKQSNYNFHSTIGTFNDRFLLRFNNNNLSNNANNFNENSIQIFKQSTTILFQSSNNKISKIEIFDLNGRLIFEKSSINANNFSINNLEISNQLVLIKTTLDNDAVLIKKLIF